MKQNRKVWRSKRAYLIWDYKEPILIWKGSSIWISKISIPKEKIFHLNQSSSTNPPWKRIVKLKYLKKQRKTTTLNHRNKFQFQSMIWDQRLIRENNKSFTTQNTCRMKSIATFFNLNAHSICRLSLSKVLRKQLPKSLSLTIINSNPWAILLRILCSTRV